MLSELLQTATLENAPAYWFLGALHILLAKSESTGGAYSLIHYTAPSGFATPYHLHHTEDEAFYVLEGELTVIRDGKKIVLGTGGYIFLPRGVSHGLRCSSAKDARVLTLVMPGGNVGFVGMMLEMECSPGKASGRSRSRLISKDSRRCARRTRSIFSAPCPRFSG